MELTFEQSIKAYLTEKYGSDVAANLMQQSLLLQYIVYKTKSADKGSKARGSFANLYAIYVIVEDYLAKQFAIKGGYAKYEGAQFSLLFKRQRELPFGAKLQNHALNSRMNEEFGKCFPTHKNMPPILRDLKKQRYWFNENYLKIRIDTETYNIAEDIIHIIDMYVCRKQDAFKRFIKQCEDLSAVEENDSANIQEFVHGLLAPNVDARLFEIVSYAILKFYYRDTVIYWGYSPDALQEDYLKLYKTGRTNANDGGIDFVMKPLGRFFQVTETLDFRKYFLDIEKIERFPLSFVVKTEDDEKGIREKLENDAISTYIIEDVVNTYLSCIEEIINIPKLKTYLEELEKKSLLNDVLSEIITQSKREFNYNDEDEDEDEDE